MTANFSSPNELWQFSINTASALRAAGMGEAPDILENATRHVTSSGWEWLGVLGQGAATVRDRYRVPPAIRQALDAILEASHSNTPYRA